MKKLAILLALCCTTAFANSAKQQAPTGSDAWAWSVAAKYDRQAWSKKTNLQNIDEMRALCAAPAAYGNQQAPKKFELTCNNEYTKWRKVDDVPYSFSNTNRMGGEFSSDKGDSVAKGYAKGQSDDTFTCKVVKQYKYYSTKTFDAYCADLEANGAFANANTIGEACYTYYDQNAEQVYYSETAVAGSERNLCEAKKKPRRSLWDVDSSNQE